MLAIGMDVTRRAKRKIMLDRGNCEGSSVTNEQSNIFKCGNTFGSYTATHVFGHWSTKAHIGPFSANLKSSAHKEHALVDKEQAHM
eukprot:1273365-Amphidinium_carterae.1